MDISLFIRGLIIGFSIAAPVGPIGLLCIRRSLSDGFVTGFCTGLGAAMADTIYGLAAALGLAAASSALMPVGWPLHILGGVFLLYLGYSTLRSKPGTRAAASRGAGLLMAFLSTFFLTAANPMTILSFAAIFAGIGAGMSCHGSISVACLVLGVFLGSMSWWLLLSGGVSFLREKIDERAFAWVNRGSGLLICGFAVWSLLR